MTATLLVATLSIAAAHTAHAAVPARTHQDAVTSNLLLLAKCETGYLKGGRPNWRHQNSTYVGALGFAWSTWNYYRRYVRPLPPAVYRDGQGRIVWTATRAQQLAVAQVLVRVFGGYSSWPACHRRLGLPG